MASIVWSDVTVFDSALSAIAVDAQDVILGHVNSYLDVGLFGGETSDKTKLLRILLAAHLGTMIARGGSGPSGPVSGESTGGISRSYAVAASTPGAMNSTTHGQTFGEIIRNSVARSPINL